MVAALLLSLWSLLGVSCATRRENFLIPNNKHGGNHHDPAASFLLEMKRSSVGKKVGGYDRELESSEECPICGRLNNATFLSEKDLFDNNCGVYLSQENIKNFDYNNSTLFHPFYSKCQRVQGMYEFICCDVSAFPPKHVCETNIQSEIITDSYSTSVPPAQLEGGYGVTEVKFFTELYFIDNVDPKTSTASIFARIHLSWKDPRLAWNVDADKCTAGTRVRASIDAEKTDIWVPEFDILNRKDPIQEMADASATVLHDGTVIWARQGVLSPFCSFIGLRRIPFDTLGCQILFGHIDGGYTEHYIRYTFAESVGSGKSKGVRVPEYNQTYSEFLLEESKIETYYAFGGYPTIDLYFKRSSKSYVIFMIVPNILIVFMAFGQILLEPDGGERVSFGITAVLVLVAQGSGTFSFLPVCDDMLWLNEFNLVSMIFVILVLVESMLVVWITKVIKMIDRELGKTYTRKLEMEESTERKEDGKTNDHPLEERSMDSCPGGDNQTFERGTAMHDNDYDLSGGIDSYDNAPSRRHNRFLVFIKSKWSEVRSRNVNRDFSFIQRQTEKKRFLLRLSRRLDRVFTYMFPIFYALFIIIFLARNSKYEDNAKDFWVPRDEL